ncbi:MAG: class I SAM-dependent methyltransferase [Pyrinomonadaceae bacterium]
MSSIQSKDSLLREWRESAPYWERHAKTIRTMFAPVTRALIEEAGITEGQKVLDVAGGPGEPSLSIAEVVGPSGLVMCTDLIAEMVAAAEREAGRRELTNVKFQKCSVESLPFEDNSFDAVVSRLGVMFFPDPLAGLREMIRVTRPKGIVSLAAWGRSDRNPFSYLVTNVTSRFIQTPPADPNGPGAFRYAESGKLAATLAQAGATGVKERLLRFCIAAPVSFNEFWEIRSQTSGTLRENLEKLSAEERIQVTREVEEAAREFFPKDEMSLPAQMLIVTGHKPTPNFEFRIANFEF